MLHNPAGNETIAPTPITYALFIIFIMVTTSARDSNHWPRCIMYSWDHIYLDWTSGFFGENLFVFLIIPKYRLTKEINMYCLTLYVVRNHSWRRDGPLVVNAEHHCCSPQASQCSTMKRLGG